MRLSLNKLTGESVYQEAHVNSRTTRVWKPNVLRLAPRWPYLKTACRRLRIAPLLGYDPDNETNPAKLTNIP